MVTGSITRAADLLFITQPATSSIIRHLENELGFLLFKRVRGRVIPTHEARYLFSQVERVLSELDTTVNLAKQIKDKQVGQLRIASMPAISLHLIPDVIKKFLLKHPRVSVSLLTANSPIVREGVSANQFDLGVVQCPIEGSNVEIEQFTLPCICILPKRHKLAQKTIINPDDLRGFPFILTSGIDIVHFKIKRTFEEAGVPLDIKVECSFFEAICNLVAKGLGVSIIEPFTALDFRDRGIVCKPFHPQINFEFGIIYPANSPRADLTEEFSTILKEQILAYSGISLKQRK